MNAPWIVRPGDAIRIFAPSSPASPARYLAGKAVLEQHYRVLDDGGWQQKSDVAYLAGSDHLRIAQLRDALSCQESRALVCARGGYGASRLLHALERELFVENRKPIVGFSDITALHCWAIHQGLPTIHGPVVSQLGELPDVDRRALTNALAGESDTLDQLRPLSAKTRGVAVRAKLFGGNLTLLAHLCGTPWALPPWPAILLLEDVGEQDYRIDRYLTQLSATGVFNRVEAILLGEFCRCGDATDVDRALRLCLEPLGIPIWRTDRIGHGARNHALWLGREYLLDTTAGALRPAWQS